MDSMQCPKHCSPRKSIDKMSMISMSKMNSNRKKMFLHKLKKKQRINVHWKEIIMLMKHHTLNLSLKSEDWIMECKSKGEISLIMKWKCAH